MKTATSKFVTTLDVCVVVGACACGAVSSIVGIGKIKELNQKIREADRVLSLYTDETKEKRRAYYMLILVFLVMTGMIAMDVTAKMRSAKKIKTVLAPEAEQTEEILIKGYFPFYALYFMLMALQVQFAQTALGLGRRYRRLNLAIQSAFPKGPPQGALSTEETFATTVLPSPSTQFRTDAGKSHLSVITTGASNNGEHSVRRPSIHLTAFHAGKSTSVTNVFSRNHPFLDRLALTHSVLGEAVGIVSAASGFTLLTMLASCLLHLVATSYFLFVEVLGENDTFVASLQLLWVVFHVSRLLLIVEPCHRTSNEAGRTIVIICDIIRNCKDSSAEHSLQKFWNQLLADKTHFFSACSMCRIDRQILTSVPITFQITLPYSRVRSMIDAL